MVPRLLVLLPALLLPWPVYAQLNPCPIPLLPCGGGGAAGASSYVADTIFPALRIGFVTLGLAYFFYYAVVLLLSGNQEESSKDIKQAYETAIYGAAFVSLATFIVESFNDPTNIINPTPIETGISNVIFWMKLILAVVATAHITIQAFRLILLEAREGEAEKVKRRFLEGLLGVGMILLANPVVEAIEPGARSAILAEEVRGAANYILELFAALIVVSFLAAGAMLILSVNEDLKEKAKKVMKNAVIATVVVLVAYVLVNFFLSL